MDSSMAECKLTEKEEASVKADLLSFIHRIALGEFNKPEHISAFIPAVQTLARFF